MAADQTRSAATTLRQCAEHALLEMRDRFELKRGDSISLDALEDALSGVYIEDEPREKLRVALRDILLIESGRNIRHRMDDEEMWQAMTDIARAALEANRGS